VKDSDVESVAQQDFTMDEEKAASSPPSSRDEVNSADKSEHGAQESGRPSTTSLDRAKDVESGHEKRLAKDGEKSDGAEQHRDDAADLRLKAHGKSKEFEVHFEGAQDPLNPRNMTKAKKWLITLIICSGSLCTTCTAASYTQTYMQLKRDFGTSRELATAGLSLYVMGLGVGPMLLGPLSEFYGRRPIYICSFAMFCIWLIPCAVAKNIETLLIARFLDGMSGSAFLSVAGGTVGDLFDKSELSLPMMVYTASPFVGPEVGPILGGFINQYADWRWTFYVAIIWAAFEFFMILVFVPETYHPVALKKKATRLRKETGNEKWYAPMEVMDKSVTQTVLWSCIRPFQLLTLEPMCLFLCLISSVLLGILYLFFGAFELVFGDGHGFSQSEVGLAFVGILVGMIIGVSCDPLWRRNYARLVRNNGGVSEPEFRLPPTIVWVMPIRPQCRSRMRRC